MREKSWVNSVKDFMSQTHSPEVMDQLLDHLLDPITGSPAHGKTVLGAMALRVDDLFFN